MSWYLRLLGGLRLEQDGVPLQGKAAHRRRLAILALLASSPSRSLARDRIIAILWPEASPEAGRKLLSESVYVLRRTLGDEALQSVGAELLLDRRHVRTDVDDLEGAITAGDMDAAALAYAGPFLDGWYISDATDFEHWVDQQREAVQRLYLTALESTATVREEGCDWNAAAALLRIAANIDPYSSRIALRLARVLASSGEPAAASQALTTHAQRLQSELGVEPAREVVDLIETLRDRGRTFDSPRGVIALPQLSTGERATAVATPTDVVSVSEAGQTAATELRTASQFGVRIASPRSHQLRQRGALIVAIAMTVMVAALLIGNRNRTTALSPTTEPRRVAVLYLDAAGDSNDLHFIADELTTEVINELGFNGFRLVSTSATKAVRDGRLQLDSLISSDSVGTLVEGSIRRADERLEATVRITDAGSAQQIATGSFAHAVTEVFALEHELTQFVTRELAQHFRREVAIHETDGEKRDPLARKLLYLARRKQEDAAVMVAQGHQFDLESANDALTDADSLLKRALKLEPQWNRVIVMAGFVALERARLANGAERQRRHDEALLHAEDVLRTDPDNAAALELRGSVRWAIIRSLAAGPRDTVVLIAAENDLERAVDLDPNRATAWMTLSNVQAVRGKPAASRIAAARALENNAYLAESQDMYFSLFTSAMMSDSLQAADRWCSRGYRAFPADARFSECELTLLRERAFQRGDDTRAWALVARLDSLDRHKPRRSKYAPIFRRVVAAAVSAKAGDHTRARAELRAARKAVAGSREFELDLAFDEAAVQLALGDRSAALRLLREVIAARPVMARVIERAPLFSELRAELNDSATKY